VYTTYVLYSDSYDKIYIGFTSDLTSRIKSHNELSTKGCTVKYRPWILIYHEVFATKQEAMKREKALKSHAGRDFIWQIANKYKTID
jgi:putative endonuclease